MTDFQDEITEAGYEPFELLAEFYALECPFKNRLFADLINYLTTDELCDFIEYLFDEYDYKPNDFKRF